LYGPIADRSATVGRSENGSDGGLLRRKALAKSGRTASCVPVNTPSRRTAMASPSGGSTGNRFSAGRPVSRVLSRPSRIG